MRRHRNLVNFGEDVSWSSQNQLEYRERESENTEGSAPFKRLTQQNLQALDLNRVSQASRGERSIKGEEKALSDSHEGQSKVSPEKSGKRRRSEEKPLSKLRDEYIPAEEDEGKHAEVKTYNAYVEDVTDSDAK
ncbi:hypothetical protein JMJ77_0005532 [Colletotrichum scovillei]|uniref:Uncharacterized protein n=1 Tax=Colletotrichum scovillei TaxID=1209932 RepID=A0A9P7RIG7_9PEZI|nr:hypothetical protein JMJ77_0005532 [Colletotrichum scovillei]KAG7076753.1 hypothetical protein JMJ76_0014013 [Colletotrichum scovillei]KAG7083985.1 hypothetical protein JMJ78_0009425 [Colletotrichum scovillei]